LVKDFPNIHPKNRNTEIIPVITKKVPFRLNPKNPQIMEKANIKSNPAGISNSLFDSIVV